MHFAEQLGELNSGRLEVGLLIDVGSQANNNVVFFMRHNECKDSELKARITRIFTNFK